jgi:hypothetical protein
VTEGCRGSEFFMREKTLVVQKAYAGCSTDRPRTYASCTTGRGVHTRVALLTGRVPVDRLVSVED